MLFHLAYINLAASFVPMAARIGFEVAWATIAATKIPGSDHTDCNMIFTAAELDRFRRTDDVSELKRIHASAEARGQKNEGDEFCDCGHAKTSLLHHCFNGQMILTQEEWAEIGSTTDAKRFRLLIGIGRRRAADWRRVSRTGIFGFDVCPKCGASRSAKTLQNKA